MLPSRYNTPEKFESFFGEKMPAELQAIANEESKTELGLPQLKTMKKELPSYRTKKMYEYPTLNTEAAQQIGADMLQQGYGGYGNALAQLGRYASGQDSIADLQQQIAAQNIRQQLASATTTGGYDPARQRSAMYATGDALANLGQQSAMAKIAEQQQAAQLLGQMGLSGAELGGAQQLKNMLAEYSSAIAAQQGLQDWAGKEEARDLGLLDYIQGRSATEAQAKAASEPSGLATLLPWNWF